MSNLQDVFDDAIKAAAAKKRKLDFDLYTLLVTSSLVEQSKDRDAIKAFVADAMKTATSDKQRPVIGVPMRIG